MKFVPGMTPQPLRIIGVASDIDDVHMVPQSTMTLYTPFGQGPLLGGGCSCMYERTRMR